MQEHESFETLRSKIRSLVQITDPDLDKILAYFESKTFEKNTHLLKEGNRCHFWGFIHQGLLRSYMYDAKGVELTNWLIKEGAFITDYPSFKTGSASVINVIALEDTTIVVTDFEKLQQLYTHFPLFEKFARILLENALMGVKERVAQRVHLTATERYQQLVQIQPDLLQRVPLKYIASFLSITESSLSRIRRNISCHLASE